MPDTVLGSRVIQTKISSSMCEMEVKTCISHSDVVRIE